jgi:phage I-like protein
MNTMKKMKNFKFQISNFRLLLAAIWMAVWPLRRGLRARLANEAALAQMVGLANAYEEDSQKWVQLTPIGEFGHREGIQRIDAASVRRMENSFNSLLGKMKQRFVGVPFYEGHPDVPHLANMYPDKRAHGWIKAMQARVNTPAQPGDGLWAQVDWTPTGKAFLENGNYKFHSPHFEAEEIGFERGRKVYRPTQVLSVGLTNHPNIPVNPLANTKENEMDKALLIAALGLAATASDADITTAIGSLKTEAGKVTSLANDKNAAATALETEKTTLANEKTEHGKTKTTLTNVIKQRNKITLDNAVDLGHITPAQRAEWEPKLEADFDGALVEIKALKKGMKVSGVTAGAGTRRSTFANTSEVQGRAQQVQQLVQKEMKESSCDYPTAFQRVRLANAALFGEMQDSLSEE